MYYNIRLDWNPKVIGVKNGIYQLELDKKAYDKNLYKELETLFLDGELIPNEQLPEIDLKFYFKKLKSTKMTDFMSFSPYMKHCHFLVNKSTKDLFNNFNIQQHIFFDSIIIDSFNDVINENYMLFHCPLQDWDVVDFSKSIFITGGFGNIPYTEIQFENENELKNFDGITKIKSLGLTDKFDKSLDFFHTRIGGLFVSKRLKLALEDKMVSGILFNNDVEIFQT